MRVHLQWIAALLAAAFPAGAQDLVPRAYVITPAGSSAVTLSYIWNTGDLVFDASVPVEDATGRFQLSIFSIYHSFGLLGRSANVVASVPYALGRFSGIATGVRTEAYRSGLGDSRVRLSINLRGGRAMRLSDYVKWQERTLIGVSLTAIIPIGQNDPARLVNIGMNRWAFKPEVGFSRRLRRWVMEGYAGVWLITANPEFFPGDAKRTQHPMGALEGHIGYYFKPRLWISFDGNFWFGGASAINGVERHDPQRASRTGFTVSTPVSRHQSLKFSYSQGAYVRIGGDFKSLSAAWQYSWLGKAQ